MEIKARAVLPGLKILLQIGRQGMPRDIEIADRVVRDVLGLA